MPDLINTSDVPLAPSAKTSETVLPDWYTNYAMEVLSTQRASALNPYQAYGSPRVADFTPDQQAAFEAARGAAGAFAPGLEAATGVVEGVAGLAPSSAAQPWLQRAGATSGSVVGDYMSPYSDFVVDRIGDVGARTLHEKLLPAIGDQFTGAGGYGGTRQAEAIGRAVRDTEEQIGARQAEYLDRGYQGALQAGANDLQRFGALAGTAGNLGVADVNAGITTGSALADLAGRKQQMGLTGAGALESIGAKQQQLGQQNLDIGYQDFLRQQGWDQTQIDNLVKTLGGVAPAVPKSVLEQGYGPAPGLGGNQSPSTAQAIASAIGAFLLG